MSTTVYRKALPAITLDNQGFWDSCKEHKMKLQKCNECGKFRYFTSPICPNCSSFEFRWEPVTGKATVYTYSVVHRPPSEAWVDDVPYVYAIVQLDEGPMMPTNIVGCSPDDVKIGMKVSVVYDDVTPEITVPKFSA